MPAEDWHPRTTKISAADRVRRGTKTRKIPARLFECVRAALPPSLLLLAFACAFFFGKNVELCEKKNHKIYNRSRVF